MNIPGHLGLVVAVLGASGTLALGATLAHADDIRHEVDGGYVEVNNPTNPGHLWVAIGAGNGGTVTSGGKYHDPSGSGYVAPNGGDWAIDIAGGAVDVNFYAYPAGQGNGISRPLIVGDVIMEGRLIAQDLSSTYCSWQRIEVLASWWSDNYNVYHNRDKIGWVVYQHLNPTTVASTNANQITGHIYANTDRIGSVVGIAHPGVGCNTGTHLHMEPLTYANMSVAFEWHGFGPDWFSPGHLHRLYGQDPAPPGTDYVTDLGLYPPTDVISNSTVIGFIGGDRNSFAMFQNPQYRRRPPVAPQMLPSTDVGQNYAVALWEDNSSDETSVSVHRYHLSTGWVELTAPGALPAGTMHFTDLSPQLGQYYGYQVTANNIYGRSWADTYSTLITKGPPVAPQATYAFGVGASPPWIQVGWHDRSNDEDGFCVYRLSGGSWNPVYTAPPNYNSDPLYSVALLDGQGTSGPLTPGSVYSYWITSFKYYNGLGCDYYNPMQGWAPGYISAAAPGPYVVGEPVSTGASTLGTTAIVNWTDVRSDELGYGILKYSAGGWVAQPLMPPNTSSYVESLLPLGVQVAYWPYAYFSVGDTDPVARAYAPTYVSVNVPKANPPRSVSAAGLSNCTVRVVWADYSDDEESFQVHRYSAYPSPGYYPRGTVGENLVSWLDVSLSPNYPYAYWPVAVKRGALTYGAGYMSAYTRSTDPC